MTKQPKPKKKDTAFIPFDERPVVEIKNKDYQPAREQLKADLCVPATFDEAIEASSNPVRVRKENSRKSLINPIFGTFPHNSLIFARTKINPTKTTEMCRIPAALLAALFVFTSGAAHAQQWTTVKYVVDGDTVEIDGKERVRLLGIDAPEDKRLRKTKDGKKLTPAQPFYIEAKRFLRRLVEKKRVKIVLGEESVGYYGRTLAYLYLPDGTDVQQELIRRGYAMAVVYPPNSAHLGAYGETEARACRAGRGLWGHPHFSLQNLRDGKEIRHGLGRIAGVVSAVTVRGKNVRITVSERVTLLIYRGAWRKLWPGQGASDLIGKYIIARGRVRPAGSHKIMRVHHPFMLRDETCAASGMAPL